MTSADRRCTYSALMLDIDVVNAHWYRAVRDGLVAPHPDEPNTWRLTDAGEAVVCDKVWELGLDPDTLTAGQLISLAAYGTPDMG